MPNINEKYLRWEIPEYKIPERGRTWYIVAGSFLFLCIFFSFFTINAWRLEFLGYNSNFLFAIILIIATFIMYINEKRPPMMIKFELGPDGIKIGSKFYDYDEIKHFCVFYKPKLSIKSLYFEFKTSTKMRLSVPLRRMDALTVRSFLVRYLNEDLERENEPLSEQLTKLLKL